MNTSEKRNLSSEILQKAKELGASLVGITSVEQLRQAPSFVVAPKMPEYNGVGHETKPIHDKKPGEVNWPEGAKSIIVLAYSHPENQPELDYWYGQTSPSGNTKLIAITNELGQWLQQNYAVNPVNLPYHVERGGIYLKDAAVLAGLGCVGNNNLLLTPEYGSLIRLRAMAIDIDLPSTGPQAFDPCKSCDKRCISNCPQKAFDQQLYFAEEYGRQELPGRKGNYSRVACNIQMKADETAAAVENSAEREQPVIKYCRQCEFSCPVGRTRPSC